MADQREFFDLDKRDRALSVAGDPFERLAAMVDFEVFFNRSSRHRLGQKREYANRKRDK